MATCSTCPHACSPGPGGVGRCRARVANADASRIESRAYGRITSIALDPIEKKPIARWNPGTTVLSVGTYGCNMSCPFCQNASIAQVGENDVPWRLYSPAEIVETAASLSNRRCIGIAYTYNEPLISWEFLRDTAMMAHAVDLANVIVSNGMATAQVINELVPYLDAANIDLKCFTEEGYRSLGGDLETVKATIETLAATPTCHLEVTTLAVPGLVDEEQVDAAASWLASLDPDITYHITRFFPRHRMSDREPTPGSMLHRLEAVAKRHLPHVLRGNVYRARAAGEHLDESVDYGEDIVGRG